MSDFTHWKVIPLTILLLLNLAYVLGCEQPTTTTTTTESTTTMTEPPTTTTTEAPVTTTKNRVSDTIQADYQVI